jgi:hypothetical protein
MMPSAKKLTLLGPTFPRHGGRHAREGQARHPCFDLPPEDVDTGMRRHDEPGWVDLNADWYDTGEPVARRNDEGDGQPWGRSDAEIRLSNARVRRQGGALSGQRNPPAVEDETLSG